MFCNNIHCNHKRIRKIFLVRRLNFKIEVCARMLWIFPVLFFFNKLRNFYFFIYFLFQLTNRKIHASCFYFFEILINNYDEWWMTNSVQFVTKKIFYRLMYIFVWTLLKKKTKSYYILIYGLFINIIKITSSNYQKYKSV